MALVSGYVALTLWRTLRASEVRCAEKIEKLNDQRLAEALKSADALEMSRDMVHVLEAAVDRLDGKGKR